MYDIITIKHVTKKYVELVHGYGENQKKKNTNN